MSDHSQLNADIDRVAENVTAQAQAAEREHLLSRLLPTAAKLLLIVPAIGLVVALICFLSGTGGALLPLFAWCLLTVMVPAAWIFWQSLLVAPKLSRQEAIRAADEKLGSSERIVTADQFISEEKQSGFMKAAVEDADRWIQRGKEVTLDPQTQTPRSARTWWPAPVALALLCLTALLAEIPGQGINDANSLAASSTTVANGDLNDQQEEQAKKNAESEKPDPPKVDEPSQAAKKRQRAVSRQGDSNSVIPDNAEDSQGKMDEGETRESQQSANPSSAKGVPSASGQPSKAGDPQQKKAKKPKKKKPSDKKRDPKPKEQNEKPSGATAGQGSSKGSDNNAAPSDWSSMSQAATPQDQDSEEEDDVDDEEEEQESRGGVQPNLRDRRAPVNRDLQIGFGTNQPNPDANGRGGPGGQKKSRGVASLVLGVPIPDRVNGQPNKGRVRITQQRITPEAEQADIVNAQERMARRAPVGPVFHPQVSPWLQDYIRQYFLSQRAKHPLRSANDPASSDPSNEINPPQS